MTPNEFNRLLLEKGVEGIPLMADKYLIQGTPAVFNGSDELFYDFKRRFADKFNIDTPGIFIVGSGKLGFSYLKETAFNEESDIDVAIVDSKLFDYYFEIIQEYVYDLKSGLVTHSSDDDKKFKYFLKCLALGFIRPDAFLDILSRAEPKPEWGEFFKSISSGRSEVGDHDVKGIIYRSYKDLRRYHIYGLHSKLKELEIRQYES